MKSYRATAGAIERRWYLVDAGNQPLGRLAVKIANLLRGKNKPTFTPDVDTGDFVVVINAGRVRLSGKKEQQKIYQRYSGYRGGLKEIPAWRMRERHPDWMIRLAVSRMLPKNHQSRGMMRRLKVFAGESHSHAAQNPEPVKTL